MSVYNSALRVSQLSRRMPPSVARQFSTASPAPALSPEKEKCYVRIAGPSSYASKQDVRLFLKDHAISNGTISASSIIQGQSDVFQNHSIWLVKVESQNDAVDIASNISGRVLGLKLIRAAAVDQKMYDNMVAVPTPDQKGRNLSLRKRMNVIAPAPEERGRALLARNLTFQLHPRVLWSFFGAYDVVDVKHLRRSGVACIVFQSEDEACRALRERNNMVLQGQQPISLKLHV